VTDPTTAASAYPVLPLRCGQHWYALPLEAVVEVAAMVAVTPIPGAHEAVMGVANRGGDSLPILDLRKWLGLETTPVNAQTLFVVARDAEHQMGLVVDEVQPIRRYSQHLVESMQGDAHWVSHTINEGDTLIQILHMPALMSAVLRVMRT